MRKSALTFAMVLTLAALAFGAVQITVSGIGVGFDSDQTTADQYADQQASNNMQMQCVGVIVSSSNERQSGKALAVEPLPFNGQYY